MPVVVLADAVLPELPEVYVLVLALALVLVLLPPLVPAGGWLVAAGDEALEPVLAAAAETSRSRRFIDW